jgi:hypothetical protein
MWGSLFTAVLKSNFTVELFTADFKISYIIINVMTLIESILAISISLITIITSTALGVRWLTKHYFEEIKHEMKPNGGSSIKDQVSRMEKDILDLKSQNVKGEEYHEKLDQKIENLTKLFVEYITRSGK